MPMQPFASFAVTVNMWSPACSGSPVSEPSDDSSRPGGNVVVVNVYGAAPPVAVNVVAYGTPSMPSCSDGGVIAICAHVVINVYVRAVAQPSASVAVIVNVASPDPVGVPARWSPTSEMPSGNVPDASAYVNGATPPATLSVTSYATPVTARGSVAGSSVPPQLSMWTE